MPRGRKRIPLEGKVFGKLTVLHTTDKVHREYRYICLCECGNKTKPIPASKLRSGHTKSCGCLKSRKGSSHPNWRGVGDLSHTHFVNLEKSAKSRGLEVSIDLSYLWELFKLQEGKCALSGVALHLDKYGSTTTASVDRINPSKGYIEGNVQWVHKELNLMKGSLTCADFVSWCKKVSHAQV